MSNLFQVPRTIAIEIRCEMSQLKFCDMPEIFLDWRYDFLTTKQQNDK